MTRRFLPIVLILVVIVALFALVLLRPSASQTPASNVSDDAVPIVSDATSAPAQADPQTPVVSDLSTPSPSSCDQMRVSDGQSTLQALAPVDNAVSPSQPTFCWAATDPPPATFIVEVVPRDAVRPGGFSWRYEACVRSTDASKRIDSNRWQLSWAAQPLEGAINFSAFTSKQGSEPRPFDRAPMVLPPGEYLWRVEAGNGCAASSGVQSSEVAQFSVRDSWQELLRDYLNEQKQRGYYLDNLTPLDLGPQPSAVVVFGSYEPRQQQQPAPPLVRFSRERMVAMVRSEDQQPRILSEHTAPLYTSVDNELSGKDINGDGIPELVLNKATGANGWSRSWVEIYQLRGDALQRLPMELPIEVSPSSVKDIDGDGIYEVTAIDFRFESDFWCHACAPQASVVLAWQGDRYVEASSRYPQFYDEAIARYRSRLDTAVQKRDPDGTTSAAVGLLISHAWRGDPDTGWAIYRDAVKPENLTGGNAQSTDWWQKYLPELNLLLARRYGFPDFDAGNYLSVSTYPQGLKDKITQAIAVQEAVVVRPSSPYLEKSPDVTESGVSLGRQGPEDGDHVDVGYDRAFDQFYAVLWQRNPTGGDCVWDEMEQAVPGLLGVEDLNGLFMRWSRLCNVR